MLKKIASEHKTKIINTKQEIKKKFNHVKKRQ